MPDRIPCINPRCRRTAARDKFPHSNEIICGKCFRTLPVAAQREHRRLWREIRKWERRITRTSDDIVANRIRRVLDRKSAQLNRHWDSDIEPQFLAPQKPAGLDAFFEEAGL